MREILEFTQATPEKPATQVKPSVATPSRKAIFYVVLGASGSGKDFLANLVRLPIVKFAAPYKRKVENLCGLPIGSLEYREVKAMPCSLDPSKTYLQVLMDEYHRRESEPVESLHYADHRYWEWEQTKYDVRWYAEHGLSVMFTDCRNIHEAELIASIANELDNYVVIHYLERDGAKALSTDLQLSAIGNYLVQNCQKCLAHISKNETSEDLIAIYKNYQETLSI